MSAPAVREAREIDYDGAEACPRCLPLTMFGALRVEMVMPLPKGDGVAPHARDGSGPCCFDCAAADGLWRAVLPGKYAPISERRGERPDAGWFLMARIAVGNDRAEQMRLPGCPMGLVYFGLVNPSRPGDLDRHYAWLNSLPYFRRGDAEDMDL